MQDYSISINNLCFDYGKNLVLKNINFAVSPGQIVTILGANGSGKTTLLNCLAGHLAPASGEILLQSQPIATFTPSEIAKIISYVPQTILPTFSYTVLEYVVTGVAPNLSMFERPSKKHYDKACDSLLQMSISHLADRPYTDISVGQRQQACIARALTQDTDFILFDEPTSHLDYGNQIATLKTIKRLASAGKGILFTTHNPDHALLLGGDVAMLNSYNNFTFGKVDKIVTQNSLVALYNTPVALCPVPTANRDLACVAQKI